MYFEISAIRLQADNPTGLTSLLLISGELDRKEEVAHSKIREYHNVVGRTNVNKYFSSQRRK